MSLKATWYSMCIGKKRFYLDCYLHHGKNTVHRQFLKILIPGEQLHQRQFPTSCSSRTDPAEPQRMAWSQARNVGLPNNHTGNGLKDQRLNFRSNHWSKITDDSSVNLHDANSSTISFFQNINYSSEKCSSARNYFILKLQWMFPSKWELVSNW